MIVWRAGRIKDNVTNKQISTAPHMDVEDKVRN